MEGTGSVMAVMDAMGHGSVNTTRIYTHSNVQQIREAIERRNQLLAAPVEAVRKSGHSRLKQPCQEMLQVIEGALVALTGIEPVFED